MSFIGRLAYVSAGGSEIGKITSASFSINNETADNTTNDDDGATSTLYSNYSCSIDITCKYDYTDAGQLAVITEATSSRAGVAVIFQPRTLVGEYEGSGTFRVTSCNIDTQTSESAEASFTLESTGAVTWTAQT